jgi:hypothetical protein
MWAGLINSQDIAGVHISVFFPIGYVFIIAFYGMFYYFQEYNCKDMN